MSSLREWMRDVIKESLAAVQDRKANSESNAVEIKSMLELFVEQSHDDTEGMGPDDLVDFILIFVLAAQDTSAVSLSWFFLMLSKHPEVEKKIRMEMAAILPDMDVTPETYLTTDHVQKLVYLEATIKEVLRLYPAIPLFFRECAEDTVIGRDVAIRKGQMINISPFAMARSTKVWGPDAAEFKPERWIDPTSGELKVIPSTVFSTFSTGPRICIGMKLATLELRVVTANLLHRYRFDLTQPNDALYRSMIALVLKNPLVVTAKRVASHYCTRHPH